MTAESLFSALNVAILPAWALLVLAPRWRWTRMLIHSAIVPALLIVLYAFALYMMYTHQKSAGDGFQAVQHMLSAPWGLLAVWTHAVVFDLLVGAWQVRDAERHHIPHWLLVPCLILTLFYGPLGIGLYLLIRSVRQRIQTIGPSSVRTRPTDGMP